MRKFINKPISQTASFTKNDGKSAVAPQKAKIKLKEVSETEREQLRIPSYQYLLP